jgi:hypothetical protein
MQDMSVASSYKKGFFMHLTSCVIPQAVRDAHEQSLRDELRAQVASSAGPPMG